MQQEAAGEGALVLTTEEMAALDALGEQERYASAGVAGEEAEGVECGDGGGGHAEASGKRFCWDPSAVP